MANQVRQTPTLMEVMAPPTVAFIIMRGLTNEKSGLRRVCREAYRYVSSGLYMRAMYCVKLVYAVM
jgi:hypothetical protein